VGQDELFAKMPRGTAVPAYQKVDLPLAPGMEIGYVVKDAKKWEVDIERNASEFDAMYYGKLLEKAWDEVSFVSKRDN